MTGAKWRLMWRTSKATKQTPFPGHPSSWDINKLRLIYWSNFYDSVYNSINRPPQWVIDDDDLLDKWVEEQGKEMEERAEEEYNKFQKKVQHTMPSAWDKSTVFVVERDKFVYNPVPKTE